MFFFLWDTIYALLWGCVCCKMKSQLLLSFWLSFKWSLQSEDSTQILLGISRHCIPYHIFIDLDFSKWYTCVLFLSESEWIAAPIVSQVAVVYTVGDQQTRSGFLFKGSYALHALLQVFELKCVLAVCVHNHTIMIKIHPVFFFLSTKIFTPFSYRADFRCLSVWHRTDGGPSHDCWLTEEFQHRLHWCLTSDPPGVNCHQLFQRRSRCRQEWLLSDRGVLLLDVITNIAVTIYSHHLSRWRRLRLVLKGICPRST